LELDPNNINVWNRKGNVLNVLGKSQEALNCFNKALELDSVKKNNKGDIEYMEDLLMQELANIQKTLGEKHPDYIDKLYDLATLYRIKRDLIKAKRYSLLALEHTRVMSGENNQDFISSLSQLAAICFQMGDDIEALQYYLSIKQITRRLEGENNSDYAAVLGNLGVTYTRLGDYANAKRYFEESLDITLRVVGENHLDLAACLYDLGMLYYETGDYAAAEPLLQQSMKIRKKILAENDYSSMGNYDNDLDLQELKKDLENSIASNLNSLAELHRRSGNYHTAEPLYQQALNILEGAGGLGSQRTYSQQRLETMPFDTITSDQLGEKHGIYAACLNNLAEMYREIGDYAAAKPLYINSLGILLREVGDGHPIYLRTLNNLALVYLSERDYANAEELLIRALTNFQRRKELGQNNLDFAQILNNLASVYTSKRDYAKAKDLILQALEIRHRLLGENHLDVAQSLNSLAVEYGRMGNYDKAEQHLQRALKIQRNLLGQKHRVVANTLSNLANTYVHTHRERDALTAMKEVADIDDYIIGQIFSISSERQRMKFLETMRYHFDQFLHIFVIYFSNSPIDICAAMELVLRRKALGAEVLGIQRDSILGDKYPELRAKLQEVNRLRRQIGQKMTSGPGPKISFVNYNQLLTDLNAQRENLDVELARHIPEMNLEQNIRSADLQTVVNTLIEDTVLIEFVKFGSPAIYIAFILHAKQPNNIRMVVIGKAEQIDHMIAAFRMSILDEINGRHSNDRHIVVLSMNKLDVNNAVMGSTLRAAVFDPLMSAIGSGRRLLIAPDGDLTRLPFEVLPIGDDERNGNRIIDDYQISYITTARDVVRFTTLLSRSVNDPLIIADPDFDLHVSNSLLIPTTESKKQQGLHSRDLDWSKLHFDRLLGTRYEGEEISRLLKVGPWMTGKVLESRLKSYRSPDILHIATHGFFLPNQPYIYENMTNADITLEDKTSSLSIQNLENPMLRSGLALAGVNTWLQNKPLPLEAEDGILTAEDVTAMDLSNTELVVLSACETGLGEVLTGEGVFGLRRAFVQAGSQTLVMSLWKVPDEQTKELMVDFYNLLICGKPRAEALREAQLAMKEKYPDPYYWGAFICQGNPGPLSNLNFNRII
jgi:CHAT domain-containing protein/tetratricopeptide (TPR) repeat protein